MWTNSLEEIVGQRNFDNISGLGTKISERVSWVNDAANEDSLDGIHENLSVLNLLLDKVEVPCSDTIVVDGQALRRSVVEETHLVGDIHTDWISNKCFAALNLNKI